MDNHDEKARSVHLGPDLSSTRVIARLFLRLGILGLFALSSREPFWAVLTNLLVVASCLTLLLAALRREPVFKTTLTHWDEAAIYALLSRAAAAAVAAPTG